VRPYKAGRQPESEPRLLPARRTLRRRRQGGQRDPDRSLSSGDLGRRQAAALRQGGGFARLPEPDSDQGRGGGAVLAQAGG